MRTTTTKTTTTADTITKAPKTTKTKKRTAKELRAYRAAYRARRAAAKTKTMAAVNGAPAAAVPTTDGGLQPSDAALLSLQTVPAIMRYVRRRHAECDQHADAAGARYAATGGNVGDLMYRFHEAEAMHALADLRVAVDALKMKAVAAGIDLTVDLTVDLAA